MDLTYDLHIHSCLSPCGDDDMTPGSIAGLASLIGLDAIALTDHNTCKNCAPFLAAAEQFGVVALPGMELTTMEEIHVVFYFATHDDAMRFDAFVEPRILPIPNRPKYFGNQILIDADDEPCGTFDILLPTATDITFNEAFRLAPQYNAVAVPAHIEKTSTSLLSQLGVVPEDSTFRLAEAFDGANIPGLRQKHPYLQKCSFLINSDAHTLTKLSQPVHTVSAQARTPQALFAALQRLSRGD